MKIKKIVTIAKAMISDLPVEENWYKERISICNSCPLNSEHIDPKALNFKQKSTLEFVCKEGEKRICTACGCCIERKASVKSSICGKIEIGEEPLWNAIQLESNLDKNLVVENLSTNVGDISQNKQIFLINLFKTTEQVVKFDIKVQNLKGMEFSNQRLSCSCLSSSVSKIDSTSYQIDTKISIKDFRPGLNERTMEFEYLTRGGQKRSINFKFSYVK